MKLSRQVELISFQKNSFCLEIKQLPYGVVFSYSTNIFSCARRSLGSCLSVATQDMAKLGSKFYQSMEQLWGKELNGTRGGSDAVGHSGKQELLNFTSVLLYGNWPLQRYRCKKKLKILKPFI